MNRPPMTRLASGILLAAVLAGSLAGCGAISALSDAATPLDAYDLRAPQDAVQAVQVSARSLSVEPPTTGGALETDRILIKPNAVQSLYLPGARWSASAPEMLQTLILRAFEDHNALSYVGRQPIGTSGDFVLLTEITDFQAELGADGESAMTRVRVTARVVRESDARVLARRTFTATAPSASTETLAIVQSFNDATDQLLPDLTRWALGAMGVGLPSPGM